MKKEDLLNAMNDIDDELLSDAEGKVMKKSFSKILRFGGIAALLCLAFVLIMLPMILQSTDMPPLVTTRSNEKNQLEKIPTIAATHTVSGKTELIVDHTGGELRGSASLIRPGFYIKTVVAAHVIEVLPDRYYYPGLSTYTYHVARLAIDEVLRGENLPQEIYLRFAHYGADVFDGYDTLILSLEQIGIENYLMINENKGEAAFFANMFEPAVVPDIGYGTVIAFREGVVDMSFWDKADYTTHASYMDDTPGKLLDAVEEAFFPIKQNSTLDDAKKEISRLAQIPDEETLYCWGEAPRYVTAADVFSFLEAVSVKQTVSPEGGIFRQSLSYQPEGVVVTYTRIANGFVTNEHVRIDAIRCKVEKVGEAYTADELARLPHIAGVIEGMSETSIVPSHIEVGDDMRLDYFAIQGYYRKVDGKIYGIIRTVWRYRYRYEYNTFIDDDCYYLYDGEGNGIVIESDVLSEIIGDDSIIRNTHYEKYTIMY